MNFSWSFFAKDWAKTRSGGSISRNVPHCQKFLTLKRRIGKKTIMM